MSLAERRVALLASISASLLLILNTWKKFNFWKEFPKSLILVISVASLKSNGEEFDTIAFMMI